MGDRACPLQFTFKAGKKISRWFSQPIRYRIIQSIAGLTLSKCFAGVCCLAFLCIVLLMNAPLGAWDNQAQSLNELLERYDTSRCKECHEEIYAQWEKSHHGRSIMHIFMDRYLKKGFLRSRTRTRPTGRIFHAYPVYPIHHQTMELETGNESTP